jgi:DNA-directed RNA polymerase specialized sigma24 family protein
VEVEPRLHAALIPSIGLDHAREATAEALAWAWEHWDRVEGMDNAPGYLYRVARTKARKLYKGKPVLPPAPSEDMPWIEPALPAAVAKLSDRQRVVVVLVYAFGWTQAEAARFLGLSHGAVQKHAERGLKRLRSALGGE